MGAASRFGHQVRCHARLFGRTLFGPEVPDADPEHGGHDGDDTADGADDHALVLFGGWRRRTRHGIVAVIVLATVQSVPGQVERHNVGHLTLVVVIVECHQADKDVLVVLVVEGLSETLSAINMNAFVGRTALVRGRLPADLFPLNFVTMIFRDLIY